MSNSKRKLLDRLKNAVAEDRLVIITGAGVSVDVDREKQGKIPSWGKLISAIKKIAKRDIARLSRYQRGLLNRLTPDAYLDFVHGDALIEASQIIEEAVGADLFARFVAEETKEKHLQAGVYHKEIAGLDPRAIITFNYDQCHENAYKQINCPFNKTIYSDSNALRNALSNNFRRPTLILKAHGCVSNPKTLVLTSSSYSQIINEHRAYRAVMQHILSRYTILIIGFALRDRDFDQILLTIERDYGSSVQDHIAIMKTPQASCDPEMERLRYKDMADFAMLEARYGLKILTVNEYSEIPRLIKNLRLEPGSHIHKLVEGVSSKDANVRREARLTLGRLSRVGKYHYQKKLLRETINNKNDILKKSEQIYSLGLTKLNDEKTINFLLSECFFQSELALNSDDKVMHAECIAHALISLRGLSVSSQKQLNFIKHKLSAEKLISNLRFLDDFISKDGGSPRLCSYLDSALYELTERSMSYIASKK